MGEQSASRLGGDEYQHLYSWYLILPLLDSEAPYERAIVEHPEAGAADDVTLHARSGVKVPSRFYQVKWHVRHERQYSFDSLAQAAQGKSLLQKLYEGWVRLRDTGPLEIWLVSNWPPAAHPDLGAYILDRSLSLSEAFYTKSLPSEAARARSHWASELGVGEDELREFARSLRFELSYASSPRLEELLDDRMRAYGLAPGDDTRAKILHEMRRRIQASGDAKTFTRQTLLKIIEARRLRAEDQTSPAVCLWLHAWDRQTYKTPATVELDWTAHFDRDARRLPSPAEWDEGLLPELRRVREDLRDRQDGRFIDLRARAPLTVMIAVGATFPHVGGFSFRVGQPTGGRTHLWRTDADPSESRFEVMHSQGAAGTDVVLGLAVSGDASGDIQRLCDAYGFDGMLYCEPSTGTGASSVASENDLCALSVSAKEVIRLARGRFSAHRIHLVYYGPLSLALAIGQHLNAVGTIITYERDSGGGYQPSLTLHTG